MYNMWRVRNADNWCPLCSNNLGELRRAILKKKGSPKTKLLVANQPHIFKNQSPSTDYNTINKHISSKPGIFETQA